MKAVLRVLGALPVLLVSCTSGPDEASAPESPATRPNPVTRQERTARWTLLFDGVSTSGWRGINSDTFPDSGWEIRDHTLVLNAIGDSESVHGGDIVTVEQFGDFDFRWEWRMDTRGGNSGVKYYVQEREDDEEMYGFGLEYQILDDPNHEWMLSGKMKPNDYHTLGGLYELYAPSADKAPRPLGQWNSSRIVSRHNRVQHWLNGTLILEFEKGSEDFLGRVAASKFKDVEGFGRNEKGHILLQDHGSVVHFRNLKIRDLSGEE